MAKIVIIGNSSAGFSCCDTLLKNSASCEITVISQEEYPAYKKNLLIDYLEGSIKEEELFLCENYFYEKNKIDFLKGAKVIRIDTKKRAVGLKDNRKINFDYLVIASGQKVNIPDIPGKGKDGVFAVYDLEGIKKIKERLMIAHTLAIIGEAKLALKLGEVIAKRDKEIKIISSSRPESFMPNEKIEWIDNFGLAEFIGEGAELKAMKLNNGKAVGISLALFIGNYLPSTEFLKETEIKTHQDYILADDAMATNMENIFACGSVCKNANFLEIEKTWDEAAGEGALAAQNIIKLLERGKELCQQTS